jgi:hypothetical protein
MASFGIISTVTIIGNRTANYFRFRFSSRNASSS